MLARILLVVGLLALLFAAGCQDNGSGSGGDSTVTFSVFDDNAGQTVTPAWIAFQDGVDGTWTRLTGSSPYTVPVTDPAGAYGFAFAVEDPYGTSVYLVHGTLAEATSLTYPVWISEALGATRRTAADRRLHRPAPAAETARFDPYWSQSGACVNVPDGIDFKSYASPGGSSVGGYFDPDYTWDFTAGEPGDAAVLLGDVDGDGDVPGCLYLRRNLDNPAGTTLTGQDIDFAQPFSAANFTYECARRSLSIPGADGIEVALRTANDMDLSLQAYSESSPFTYFAPPSSALLPTDRIAYEAYSYANNTGVLADSLSATITALTLPTPFTCTLDDSDGYTLQGLTHPTATVYGFWLEPMEGAEWEGYISLGWLQAADSTNYTLPDFTGVDGWQSGWALVAPFYGGEAYADSYTGTFAQYLMFWSNAGSLITVQDAWCELFGE